LYVIVGAKEAAQPWVSAGGRTGVHPPVHVDQAKGIQMLMPGEAPAQTGYFGKWLAVICRVAAVALCSKNVWLHPMVNRFLVRGNPIGDFLVGSRRVGSRPPFRFGEAADYAGQGNVK